MKNFLQIKIYRCQLWKAGLVNVILSCLNECIEFTEEYFNDAVFESDHVFDYYYIKANDLADIILNSKEHLNIEWEFI
jgi:hypothetical protein